MLLVGHLATSTKWRVWEIAEVKKTGSLHVLTPPQTVDELLNTRNCYRSLEDKLRKQSSL